MTITFTDLPGLLKNLRNCDILNDTDSLEALIEDMKELLETRKHTMTGEDLYKEWYQYKEARVSSKNTLRHYTSDYNSYLADTKVMKSPIDSFDEIELEGFYNALIRDNALTKKQAGNVKTVLMGMYHYAWRKRYLKTDPFAGVKRYVRYSQSKAKSEKTETFNDEERDAFISWCMSRYEKGYAGKQTTSYLAVAFQFHTGLRVGELVALKWTDIDDDELRVTRQEIYDGGRGVVEHTKTNTARVIPLSSKALEILQMVKEKTGHQEWVFLNQDGERLQIPSISSVFAKYKKVLIKNAKKEGVAPPPIKSSHKVRKTFGSNCIRRGMPVTTVAKLLGHSTIETTMNYYAYNIATQEETKEKLELI